MDRVLRDGRGRRIRGELSLLHALERRMAPLGLAKLSVLIPEAEGLGAFTENGFHVHHSVRYLERAMPIQRREIDALKEVGGRILPPHLWDRVAGMTHEKTLLEERLVTPLAQPELAERFGVVPRARSCCSARREPARPRSRAPWPHGWIGPSSSCSHRGWPMAAPASRAGCARRSRRSTSSSTPVVFIDEVEEIASRRGGTPPSPTQGVTNELLKLVADFRDREGRILICATNFVRALDAAFLRHGRFDYVIPIGLPDSDARRAIWARYIPAESAGDVDLDRLVTASEGLTPADIEYAARRASQEALARALRTARRPRHSTRTTTRGLWKHACDRVSGRDRRVQGGHRDHRPALRSRRCAPRMSAPLVDFRCRRTSRWKPPVSRPRS
jgi:hypothetical protein